MYDKYDYLEHYIAIVIENKTHAVSWKSNFSF